VRKKIFVLGIASLIILGIFGCSKNKFKLTSSQPTDIPYYNLANDTCFVCHNVSTLKKTMDTELGTEIVPLYVNREKFSRSIHRANRCVDCHADIVWDNVKKEHPIVPKYYGGWANFSAEDIIQGRNYYTKASVSCVNCHTDQSEFFSSQHYLIKDIKNSRMEINIYNGIEIGKDYIGNEAKCGKCHLTCATCHFKGEKAQEATGEITDFWSQLLKGEKIGVDGLTNWAIDWTTNVEAHTFATGEELRSSNDLCRICHTGFYTNYEQKGYYHPDGFLYWDSLVSQGVNKYPQFEELQFLFGNIYVNTGIPNLDSLYSDISNEGHSIKKGKCLDCHNNSPAQIHSLALPSCKDNGCHPGIAFKKAGLHQDIVCVACHDATMEPWREPNLGGKVDTVKVAAVKNNKVINWHSHMIIKPDGVNTNYCERKCHNPETGRRIGAHFSRPHTGTIHK